MIKFLAGFVLGALVAVLALMWSGTSPTEVMPQTAAGWVVVGSLAGVLALVARER